MSLAEDLAKREMDIHRVSDVLRRDGLDAAIYLLCAMRQRQDPAGYIEFLASMFPRVTMGPIEIAWRDERR